MIKADNRIVLIFFFLMVLASGATSLVYQISFERLIRSFFGGDNTSSIIIVTAFLTALGIGAVLFRNVRTPVLTYSVVEIAIGVFSLFVGLNLTELLEIIDLLSVKGAMPLEGGQIRVFISCFIFSFFPAMLMGGTLPLMVETARKLHFNKFGALYSINTAGAAAGIVLAPFFLLNSMSLEAILVSTGLVNILIGCVIFPLHLRVGRRSRPDNKKSPSIPVERDIIIPRFDYILCFMSGGVIFLIETFAIIHAFQINNSSPYNFAFVIFPVILTMAFASWFWTRFNEAHKDSSILLICFAAVISLYLTPSISSLFLSFGYYPNPLHLLFSVGYYFLIIGFPVFFVSALFPLICQKVGRNHTATANSVGRLYFFSAMGSLVLGLGYFIVASFGISFLLYCTALLLVLSSVLVIQLSGSGFQRLFGLLTVGFCSLLFYQAPTSQTFVFGDELSNFQNIKPGVGGSVSLTSTGMISVNGQKMGRFPVEERTIRQWLPIEGYLTEGLETGKVVVLGLGAGQIIRQILESDLDIEEIVVIDWSIHLKLLLQDLDPIFSDPRIKYYHGDASVVINNLEKGAFDLVFDNLAFTHWVGATAIKTPIFFKNIQQVLNSRGVYAFAENYQFPTHKEKLFNGVMSHFSYAEEYSELDIVLSHSRNEADSNFECLSDAVAAGVCGLGTRILKHQFHGFGVFSRNRFSGEFHIPREQFLHIIL